MTDKLLTLQQVAQFLGVSAGWIYGRIHAKTLPFPHVKVGVYVRFRQEDIAAWLNKQIEDHSPGLSSNQPL